MPAYPFVGSLGWRVPTDQVRPRRLLSKQSGFSSLCDRRLGASGGRARGKGRRTCRTRRCPTPTSTSALARSASYFDAPFLLIALGERTLPSGLAGALAPTSPILIGIFAPFIGRSERISRRQSVGLSIGLLGARWWLGLTLRVRWVSSLVRWLFLVRQSAVRCRASSSRFGTETENLSRLVRPLSSRSASGR
jgi:hypothetical protein